MIHPVEQLAALIHASTPADYPESTLRAMQKCLLATLGIALAGSRSHETGGMLSALALHKSRKGQATVWGTELRVDRRSAALVNGVSANPTIRDEHSRYDDIGAVIIPALIAWAEGRSTPATGLELLHACIMGYEVVGRMQAAWGGSAAINTDVPKPGAYTVQKPAHLHRHSQLPAPMQVARSTPRTAVTPKNSRPAELPKAGTWRHN